VRMALGASAHDVRYLVLRETIGLAGLGILIGIAIAVAASRLVETFPIRFKAHRSGHHL
jgi:ABC-type antimicrobial peptide transport system permease subunit